MPAATSIHARTLTLLGFSKGNPLELMQEKLKAKYGGKLVFKIEGLDGPPEPTKRPLKERKAELMTFLSVQIFDNGETITSLIDELGQDWSRVGEHIDMTSFGFKSISLPDF